MQTIGALIWGIIAGVFVSVGIIVFTTLIGAGAEIIGFTKYTFWYYVTCLSICIAFLVLSKPARHQVKYMGFYFIAVVMVIGIGFEAFTPTPSGEMGARVQDSLRAIGILLSKAWMYIAPAAITAYYSYLAFEGVTKAKTKIPKSS